MGKNFSKNSADARINSRSAVSTVDVEKNKANPEEIILISFEEEEATREDSICGKRALCQLIDYWKVYDEKDSCVDFIRSVEHGKIFLVIWSSNADNILREIHDFQQINSIFIFSIDIDTCLSLKNNYSKIVDVYNNQNNLMEHMQKTIQLIEKQSISLNLFDQREKTIRDLTRESGSFLFFQLFKNVLLNMPKTPESKQEMIDKCREYYRNNPTVLEEIDTFDSTYNSDQAINWYTQDIFLYRLVNKSLRTEDINELFRFRFFIIDLSLNLAQMYKKLKKTAQQPLINLYRGVYLTDSELEKLKNNIGNFISTNGFLSTSRSREIAYTFSKNVLFEITIDLRLETIICADVASNSQFQSEEEVLFDLGATFRIDDCIFDDVVQKWFIKLTATDKGAELASEYIEYQKKRMAHSDIILMFGHLLAEMGDYNKSQKYFQNVLSSKPNDEEVASAYYNIGRTCRLKGDYDSAIYNYDIAYKMYTEAQPQRTISAAKTLIGIAVIYNEQKDYDNAIQKLTTAYKMLKKKLGKDSIDIADILNNLGNAYQGKGDLDLAFKLTTKALKVSKKNLPRDHPHIATILNNIGNIHYRMDEYTSALDYYTKGLEINRKVLPSDHQDLARNLDNIGLIHFNMKKYDQAFRYCTDALTIVETTLLATHPLVRDIRNHMELINQRTEA